MNPRSLGARLGLLTALAGLFFITLPAGADPIPIPLCNGETATIVLVSEADQGFYARMWSGVTVIANEDNVAFGTFGHDVMVALIPTMTGGLVSSPPPHDASIHGDSFCTGDGPDIIYGSKKKDYISTGKGQDRIYTYGGPDRVQAGSGMDRIWAAHTKPGAVLRGGGGMDHFYGPNPGVVIYGGSAPPNSPGGGDHVHPCPISSDALGVQVHGIEYIGPESAFSDSPFNPCTNDARPLEL